MERQKNVGRIEVWVCRDWAGSHIFGIKPTRINNGNPTDEWYETPSCLENIITIKNMIYDFTYGWDVNHEPQKIIIKFEIL